MHFALVLSVRRAAAAEDRLLSGPHEGHTNKGLAAPRNTTELLYSTVDLRFHDAMRWGALVMGSRGFEAEKATPLAAPPMAT